ncbi:hypothetical protein KM043_016241 [Ampulex compressa]|nr:hypothetical protein KM043_016241 [Ampulex compressa]
MASLATRYIQPRGRGASVGLSTHPWSPKGHRLRATATLENPTPQCTASVPLSCGMFAADRFERRDFEAPSHDLVVREPRPQGVMLPRPVYWGEGNDGPSNLMASGKKEIAAMHGWSIGLLGYSRFSSS